VKGKFEGATALDHSLRGDTYVLSPQTFERTAIPPFGTIRFLDPFVLPSDFALFIDDLAENVEGAASIGLRAHRHTDRASTVEFLVRHGIPIDGAGRP